MTRNDGPQTGLKELRETVKVKELVTNHLKKTNCNTFKKLISIVLCVGCEGSRGEFHCQKCEVSFSFCCRSVSLTVSLC